MFVLNREGSIVEMTRDGYMLSSSGGKADGQDKVGLFNTPTGIGIDSKNQIYVLDQEQNLVQVFSPTPTGDSIREAIICYNNGDYSGSTAILNELLKFNNTSFFAHLYMGKNSMQTGEYETAAYHFKTANAKAEYSQAYWEIRNVWLQENLLYYLIIFLVILFIYTVIKRIGIISRIKGRISRFSMKQKLYKNKTLLGVGKLKYAIFHPIDTAYEVKVGRLGTITSGTILYALFFIEFVLFQLCSGYVFSIPMKNYSIFLNFAFFTGAVILFVIGNYFISSIQDGNGTLSSIFKVTAYSLAPIIFVLPVVTIFSNFMSMEDEFFRTTAMTVVVFWSLCNLFAGLIEIHQY